MNPQDDPEAVFRRDMPEVTPPPTSFDLDRIVRDGYRARRRHRTALGASVTAGVAAVAGVLALSLLGLPGNPDRTVNPDVAATEETTAPTEPAPVEDPTTAGYPYSEIWGYVLNEEDQRRPGEEMLAVKEAATAAFGDLLYDTGVWDEPGNPPPGEECDWILTDPLYADNAQEEYDGCVASMSGLEVGPQQYPGNYGQTYLRGYRGGHAEEDGDVMRTVFSLEVMLPGGWTAEPGPITEQAFPQHLISDGPYFTDEAPEFTTEDLDDGRTLMTADHGCAAELAVVYPNGTGLRTTWNACGDDTYPLDLDALTDAALAMPELDLDTSEMIPTGDLVDVPMGWVYDQDAWANSEEAEANAAATFDAARAALQEVFPGATLGEGSAISTGLSDRGANMQRTYSSHGTLPYETTIDTTVGDVGFDLRYYLPGGWIPGFSEMDVRDAHLTACKEGFECNFWGDDDGTMWAFEELEVTHEPEAGEDWEPMTEHQIYATLYSPDGWAVGVWVQWQDDTPIDADVLGDLLRAMPAPEYDESDVPALPAG